MTPPLPERAACLFRPRDYLRHDGDLFRCQSVAVAPDAVAITADRIVNGQIRDRATLRFAPGEILRASAAPSITAANDTTKPAALLFAT
jgi:hypothetical protein